MMIKKLRLMARKENNMFNIGDKVKCMNGYSYIPTGTILTIVGIKLAWDGQEFLHFKEIPYSYNSKDFEKCQDYF